MAVQIAQRIEAPDYIDLSQPMPPTNNIQKTVIEPTAGPMDIDVQNAQFSTKKSLPNRDSHGKARCFYCNGYGHVKKYCRKLAASRHHQNAQIQLADAASLTMEQGNNKRNVDGRASPAHSSRNLFRTHGMFHNSTNKSHNTGSPFRFMQHHIIIYYRFSLSHWIYPLHPQRRFRSSLAISKKYINPLDTHTVHSLLHNTTFFIHFMSYHSNYF